MRRFFHKIIIENNSSGKIFSTIIVFIGIGLIAIPTGLLASAFSKTLKNDNPND